MGEVEKNLFVEKVATFFIGLYIADELYPNIPIGKQFEVVKRWLGYK